MQQILNEVKKVPVPVWAELGPAQSQLVTIFLHYKYQTCSDKCDVGKKQDLAKFNEDQI